MQSYDMLPKKPITATNTLVLGLSVENCRENECFANGLYDALIGVFVLFV